MVPPVPVVAGGSSQTGSANTRERGTTGSRARARRGRNARARSSAGQVVRINTAYRARSASMHRGERTDR